MSENIEREESTLILTHSNVVVVKNVVRDKKIDKRKNFAEKFFYEQKKTVILPRSLADKIQIEPNGFEIIIDEER